MDLNKLMIIFDFDGVIVDSISCLYDVYLCFLDEMSIIGNEKEFEILNGPKLSEIVSFLKKKYKMQKSEQELLELYLNKISLMYDNVKVNDGIKEILELLKNKNIKIGLASSCKRNDIEKILKKNNLIDYFDIIVTGDDVKNAKPSPEIYFFIKYKYPEYDFYVIEDSENGIKSATQAKIKTIFYNPKKCQLSNNPDFNIESLYQIKNIIKEIELECFTISVSNNIKLNIIDYKIEINEVQKKEIEKLWEKENLNKQFFNGNIISYIGHKEINGVLNLECFITEYKYFFAQLKMVDLDFNIRPIGVSGVVIDENESTLIGIRNDVTQFSGYYELIPSGSLEYLESNGKIIDFKDQLIREFEEETQISKENIIKINPFCLIFDKKQGIYDICSIIYINGKLIEKLKIEENKEYKSIQIKKIENMYKEIGNYDYVSTSNIILDNIRECFYLRKLR